MKRDGCTESLFSFRLLSVIAFLAFLLSSEIGLAGEWRVTPIRLDFGKEAKSGVITVINEGTGKLQVQVRPMEWTQDGEGKDRYTETGDIIFFPKIMTIEKNEEKIVRAGIRMPPVTKEKTYRLFIEEIPEKTKTEGVNVAIAVRFGVPIFVKPLKPEPKGEIEKITLSKGELAMVVRNTGNQNFQIIGITVKGKTAQGEERFTQELSGWYLLSGSSRIYSAQIPTEACSSLTTIEVDVRTDKLTLKGTLDADKTGCTQ